MSFIKKDLIALLDNVHFRVQRFCSFPIVKMKVIVGKFFL